MIVLVYYILLLFYCMKFVFSPGSIYYISYFYGMLYIAYLCWKCRKTPNN